MPTRMDWVASFRRLRRKPLYTLTVALALGIGVGAVTIVFSWFEGLFLRPLPGVQDARALQVFELHRVDYTTTAFSYPDYRDMAEALAPSMDVVGYGMSRVTLSGAGKPEQHWALYVSGNFFNALALQPAAGRLLRPTDNATDPVVVLSHDWWQTRFQADPAIVGRTIYLNRHAVRVAGVAPREFQGPYTGLSLGLYLPLAISDSIEGGPPRLEVRQSKSLTLMSRLKLGVSPERAAEFTRVVVRRLDQAYPKGTFDGAEVALTPFWRSPAGAQAIMGPVMMALGGVVLMVLLLACSNALGIMLIENAHRRRDMSIRLSLGAGPGGLISHCLAESALLSVLAAGAGIFVAYLAADHLQDLAPAIPFPVKLKFPIDGPVLAFSILAAGAAAGFCGVWSGLEARWHSAALNLRSEISNSNTSRERSRLRGVFIGVQIALSFLLLSASGLFYRSVERSRTVDLGFDPRSVALDRLDLKGSRYAGDKGIAVLKTALSGVLENPGVEGASLARSVPFGLGDQEQVAIMPDGNAEKQVVWTNRVSPGYFPTLGIPLLAGRDFTNFDQAGSAPVAIVNEALAARLWKSPAPLGRGFLLAGRRYQVVGVVRNTKIWSLTQDSQPCLYLPLWQSDTGFAVMHVKAKLPAGSIHRIVEKEIERLDASLPVAAGQTMTKQLETALFPQRIALVVLGIFSLSGVYLAAMGLYGVIAHAAQSRSREIAIRMALGATAADVCGLVSRQAALLVGAGLGAGGVLAAVLHPLLRSVLVGSNGLDLVSMAATAALIALVAALAIWFPTLRAMRVAPAVALRGD